MASRLEEDRDLLRLDESETSRVSTDKESELRLRCLCLLEEEEEIEEEVEEVEEEEEECLLDLSFLEDFLELLDLPDLLDLLDLLDFLCDLEDDFFDLEESLECLEDLPLSLVWRGDLEREGVSVKEGELTSNPLTEGNTASEGANEETKGVTGRSNSGFMRRNCLVPGTSSNSDRNKFSVEGCGCSEGTRDRL